MLGIPVINASQNNPHISYNFNLHPKNITEYEKLLRNLNKINFKIDKSEIAEYYYMNNIYNTNKLFFKDYEKMEKKLGGYKKQFNPIVFNYWINEFHIDHHHKILKILQQFLSSNDYRLRKLFSVLNLENINNQLVSMGLPVFNGYPDIEECIKSIVNQTYKNIEIIISDNCSTDLTSDYCYKKSLEDKRKIL